MNENEREQKRKNEKEIQQPGEIQKEASYDAYDSYENLWYFRSSLQAKLVWFQTTLYVIL